MCLYFWFPHLFVKDDATTGSSNPPLPPTAHFCKLNSTGGLSKCSQLSPSISTCIIVHLLLPCFLKPRWRTGAAVPHAAKDVTPSLLQPAGTARLPGQDPAPRGTSYPPAPSFVGHAGAPALNCYSPTISAPYESLRTAQSSLQTV